MDIEWPLTDIEYSTVENCFQSKASVPVCALLLSVQSLGAKKNPRADSWGILVI